MVISLKKLFPLKKSELTLLFMVIILLSLSNILPYFFQDSINRGFPLHNDELFHLNQAKHLRSGSYEFNSLSGLEIGFHFFLFFLDLFFDLIKIYPLLSLIWMFITSIIIFLVTFNLTEKNYFVSLFTLIFFGSIGIDNLFLGMSFFTPLAFSIPFIFIYIYLFFEGLRTENKKFLFYSFLFMMLLLFFHPASIVFFIPLMVFQLFKYKPFIIKEKKFFSIFLVIPLVALFFYILLIKGYFKFDFILNLIYFQKDWASIETLKKIKFTKLYSPFNFFLSLIGIFYLFLKRKKKYYPYILLVFSLFLIIICFNLFSFSLFGPAQRIYFYFLIFLPLFSAFGLFFIFRTILDFLNQKKISKLFIIMILILILSISLFLSYSSSISEKINFNSFINLNKNEYDVLRFLSKIDSGNIIVPLNHLSPFIKSFAGQEPVSTWYFYHPERRQTVDSFYSIDDCNLKDSVIKYYHLDYVLSTRLILCEEFKLIYPVGPYVYDVSYLSKNYYTKV